MDLDETIHQPARLKIMASLASLGEGEEVDFTYLKELLNLTDGNLGAHLGKLEDAGYINVRKHFVERKPRTHLKLTLKGRLAFKKHVDALQKVLNGVTKE